MNALDESVAAFESLWEAKLRLQRCIDSLEPGEQRESLKAVLAKVGRSRDELELLCVALQEKAAP